MSSELLFTTPTAPRSSALRTTRLGFWCFPGAGVFTTGAVVVVVVVVGGAVDVDVDVLMGVTTVPVPPVLVGTGCGTGFTTGGTVVDAAGTVTGVVVLGVPINPVAKTTATMTNEPRIPSATPSNQPDPSGVPS